MQSWQKLVCIGAGGVAGLSIADSVLKFIKSKSKKEILVDDNVKLVQDEVIKLLVWIAEEGLNLPHEELRKEFYERFSFIQLSVREVKEKPKGV